jgi:hypothetical protein
MELNFTEIDSLNDFEDVEDVGSFDEKGAFTATLKPPTVIGSRVPQPRITSLAYKNRGTLASNAPPTPQPRKVTYDDILSSLNMTVVDGKLQITRNSAVENIRTNNFNAQPIASVKNAPRQQLGQQHGQQGERLQHVQRAQQAHNAQYAQQQQQEVPVMTKEQYRQMVAINYLKAMQERARIKNMKSTKLQFSNSGVETSSISTLNNGNLNRLFRFNGN